MAQANNHLTQRTPLSEVRALIGASHGRATRSCVIAKRQAGEEHFFGAPHVQAHQLLCLRPFTTKTNIKNLAINFRLTWLSSLRVTTRVVRTAGRKTETVTKGLQPTCGSEVHN